MYIVHSMYEVVVGIRNIYKNVAEQSLQCVELCHKYWLQSNKQIHGKYGRTQSQRAPVQRAYFQHVNFSINRSA
jgi:hypothetical protein